MSLRESDKIESGETCSGFLIDIMPPMFIPSAVGLITVWADLKEIVVPVMMIIVITTIFVMICTGKVSQGIIDYRRKKEVERKDERVFSESLYFGLTISIGAYGLGLLARKKLKWGF